MTPAPSTDPHRLLRRLELRLDRLEQTVVAGAALVTGVLLTLGTLLPLVTEGDDGTEDRDLPVGNLLTVATSALGGDTSSDDNSALGLLLVALIVLTVAALVSLAMMAGENLGLRAARAVPGLAVAVLLGGILVAGLALAAAGEEAGMHPGPGGVLFPVGAVAYAALVASRLRDRWDPARGAHLVRAAQRSS